MQVARFTATGCCTRPRLIDTCDRRQNALTQVPTGTNAC
jgi:hypothetical protein